MEVHLTGSTNYCFHNVHQKSGRTYVEVHVSATPAGACDVIAQILDLYLLGIWQECVQGKILS